MCIRDRILFLFPFWAALILSGRRQGKDEVDRAKLVLLALPVSAALSAVLFFTLGRDTYSRPDAVDHLRLRIMGELAEGDSSVAPGGTRSASQDIDLQGRGDLRFTGEVVLDVFSGNPGRLYLRGRSGARYTGSAWTAFAAVSYTHLDVYKRQILGIGRFWWKAEDTIISGWRRSPWAAVCMPSVTWRPR